MKPLQNSGFSFLRPSLCLAVWVWLAVNGSADDTSHFIDLLEGDDIGKHWNVESGKGWTVRNGVLERGSKKAGNLLTRHSFRDFELRFEWKIASGGNSGIIYRSQKGRGLEYQILDDLGRKRKPDSLHCASALYDLVPAQAGRKTRNAGEWNSGRIIAQGNHIEHWLNGQMVLSVEQNTEDWKQRYQKSKYTKYGFKDFGQVASPILIQDHGSQVWYRKLRIRRLQPRPMTDKDPKTDRRKPNILFIAVDDLRPELGCYGSPIAVSPNMDKLAREGLLFRRAYCQQAICRPSRASLMTGARPETTGLFHNYVSLRELQPDIVTLPQHLIANGYQTDYYGKIFHQGDTDEEHSWNAKKIKWLKDVKRPSTPFALPENNRLKAESMKKMIAKYGDAARRGLASGPAYENADVPDHAYIDGYETLRAIESMKRMAKTPEKPFFLALGFRKPHLNWTAPKKYWDLYDRKKIPLSEQQSGPANGAAMGLHASFELRTRAGIPKYGPIEPELARTLKHAYLACVSYVDAQIGKIIGELEKQGLRENTIIIVWGDHGWHLGDMGVWGKATNYEIATRVPLMIWTPDMKIRGKGTDALVELVDIYPTLCELAGVSLPDHLEGHSFVPLLDQPERSWKKAAFSQYPNPALREWAANPLSPAMKETWFGPLIKDVESRIIEQQGNKWDRELFEQYLMGYTMRTDRYRLVLWRDHRKPESDPLFIELYDHQQDPAETRNVADQHPRLVEKLIRQHDAGWRSAL